MLTDANITMFIMAPLLGFFIAILWKIWTVIFK